MKYATGKFVLILFIITQCAVFAQDTIHVDAGWNMIGAKSTMLQSGFTSEPSGIISSQYYGYRSGVGYSAADTLHDGKGFWVKATQSGILITALVNQPPSVPYNPLPNNTATDVSLPPILAWECSDPDNDPITYDVYFGTDNPPTTKISSGQSNPFINQSGLSNSTLYYWSVVARDSHNDTSLSPVWEFTTSAPAEVSCGEVVQYGGKNYNTVKIGTQCWFQENLDIGTMVTGITGQTDNSTIEKYCYGDNSANCSTSGGLYQWNEAMQYSTTEGVQGICPTGWHIPSYTELQTLGTTVNDNSNALKAVGQGTGGGAGTNTSGFSAQLSGYRNSGGDFYGIGNYTPFWGSTDSEGAGAYYLYLEFNNSVVYFYYDDKGYGFRVRCLKD